MYRQKKKLFPGTRNSAQIAHKSEMFSRLVQSLEERDFLDQLNELGNTQVIKDNAHKTNSSCLSILFYGSTFILACFSAAVYWYSAQKAGERYMEMEPHLQFLFEDIAPTSSLTTNLMFNWIAFIDLWEHETHPVSAVWNYLSEFHISWIEKVIAIVASAATIAPFFFIGFEGSQLQKSLVGISGGLSLPVFYEGSLNFYKYFHAPFIQRVRWFLRCSPKKNQLAVDKYNLVIYLKELNQLFYHASKEDRRQFMEAFYRCANYIDKINFLLSENNTFSSLITGFENTWCAYLRFWLSAGIGLIGLFVIAQNSGHVIGTWLGVSALPMHPILAYFLAAVFTIANLIPGLGFSFSGMSNFDLIDLGRKMIFYDIPQVQRVLMGPPPSRENFWIPGLLYFSWGLMFTVLRLLYVCSGFSNDQVNYEGAIVLHVSELGSMIFGFLMGFFGALVFNGVPCENLFRNMMEQKVLSVGDEIDIAQVKFEIDFRGLVEELEVLPLDDFKTLVNREETLMIFASFFQKVSSPKEKSGYAPLLRNDA